ncbi:MAG: hypothetical protein K1X67_16365 [Fimbriimonadaceae bacterium]|nr:hypothetical protein [Fimbriimonadaceae bacterium]
MRKVSGWTVDYGDGPRPITVPHAWNQDVPVAWEGPAIYRTAVESKSGDRLRFLGVSYEAIVRISLREPYRWHPAGNASRELESGSRHDAGGTTEPFETRHLGIWDAFDVALPEGLCEIEVEVRKNGGSTFPVRDVASGFLPFVFHTFGGIFGEVLLLEEGDGEYYSPSGALVPRGQIPLMGMRGNPEYFRGVLHWGWSPEIGHPNPPDDVIQREVSELKRLGFNLVKFCLWIPSHRYLEILDEHEMFAWIELPLWDPTPDPDKQSAIAEEMERIVVQYRHHPNVPIWTAGCELSESTTADYRRGLVEMLERHLPGRFIKDNSGSAEMYGGDLREFGNFDDFHPYCDTMFYPSVLDSLLPGPRTPLPIFLGEFNDIDVHRDLPRLATEKPFWTSADPVLNDQGVRWQHDLPTFLPSNRFVKDADAHKRLLASSITKAAFMRKFVQEEVRARDSIRGFVITGIRDTPISTSGIFDDWGQARFSAKDFAGWNGPDALFLIPVRRPPWVRGGNRAGYRDRWNFLAGPCFWRVGVHSIQGGDHRLGWNLTASTGASVAQGSCEPVNVDAMRALQVGEVWAELPVGEYTLTVNWGDATNQWPIWVVANGSLPDCEVLPGIAEGFTDWQPDPLPDPPPPEWERGKPILADRLPDDWRKRRGAIFISGPGTQPMPFWRESAYLTPSPTPVGEGRGGGSRETSAGGLHPWEDGGIDPNSPSPTPVGEGRGGGSRETSAGGLHPCEDGGIDRNSPSSTPVGEGRGGGSRETSAGSLHPWEDGGIDFEGQWERLFPIAGDCVLDPDFLKQFDNPKILLQRIDMRTYQEHAVLIEVQTEVGKLFISTLRPQGGLGCQPTSLKWNPVGRHLVASLLARSAP